MATEDIPEDVRQFIFEHIDSVEQLDVLLLLYAEQKSWSVQDINNFLRTNADSVANRLQSLIEAGVVEELYASPPLFRYQPRSPAFEKVVDELANANKIRRHAVLELIFSPLKKARKFVDAFVLRGPAKNGGANG